ncbi:hypothetical protein GUJ93_ZPchr0013g34310 [Zizania palustris]|uniref:Uncharacterized protein n=1 Tax=Zizania palustris TaxID=103762 RepID=A0A8J5X0J3_ZIZPA|nr:hypothetical protein GUJ93_ZPchr0013g34310 [Zizania palustris]
MFDQWLQAKILDVVDVSYGGDNDFNQAIELSAEISSKCEVYTGEEVDWQVLDMGAVETLIVWGNLDINRYDLKNSARANI